MSTANTLKALDAHWRDIVTGADRAERNLYELQPGFPSSTPGNGSPGGGTGGFSSIVETLCLNDRHSDASTKDLAEYKRLAQTVRNAIPALRAIVTQWDYPVAGEAQAGTTQRKAAPGDVNAYAEPGCISCHRPELCKWEPIHRAGLCRFCYDFQLAEKMLPPVELLRLKHAGKRMSTALVATHLKAARAELKAKAKAVKKTKSLTPSRPTAQR